MANMDRINAALDHIEGHLENWNQTNFQNKSKNTTELEICSTQFCFAGWGIVLFGSEEKLTIHHYLEQWCIDQIQNEDGAAISWENAGKIVFGLNDKQADRIFYRMDYNFETFKEHVLMVAEDDSDYEDRRVEDWCGV